MKSTLTKNTEPGTPWYPISVNKLDNLLSNVIYQVTGFTHDYALRRNIAYNLQYLEFLDRCLSDKSLSSVLTTQSYKMFVIVGCGIMESLLTYILIKSRDYTMTPWELECVMPGQEKTMGDGKKRIDSYVYKKLSSPKLGEMTFDAMIKKAESKKVLGSNHELYGTLQQLRKLRNKVHLQAIDDPTDTDWNSFKRKNLCSMAYVIQSSFTGKIFRPSQKEKSYFSYLDKYISE